jgi:hypothetical protein
MLRHLEVHPSAKYDLLEISRDQPQWANRLAQLIRQLKVDETLQARMLKANATTDDKAINFQAIVTQKHNHLHRIKLFDINGFSEPYRILYAVYPISQQNRREFFRILAVVHRSKMTYEQDCKIITRAISDLSD